MNEVAGLIDYHNFLHEKYKKAFKESYHSGSAGSIHQLRVTIKKYNAFFRLLKYLNKDFQSKKTFSTLKELFKKAGKLRNIQMKLVFINQLLKNSNARLKIPTAELNKKEKKEFVIYRKCCKRNKHDFQEPVERKIRKTLKDDFSLKKLKHYLVIQTKDIAKLMRQQKKNVQLHEIRILLKEYFYNIILVKDYLLKNQRKEKQINQLHKFQDDIGKWQDQTEILKFITKVDRHLSTAEKKSMQLLAMKLENSHRKLSTGLKEKFPLILQNIKQINDELVF